MASAPSDEYWTNDILQKIVDDQNTASAAITSQVESIREDNLRRDFEKFKAAGGVLPNFVARDSPGKRFSTTSNEYTTIEQFKKMPPPGELRQAARDRKMANWTAQFGFGNDKIEYVTDARRSGAMGASEEGFRER